MDRPPKEREQSELWCSCGAVVMMMVDGGLIERRGAWQLQRQTTVLRAPRVVMKMVEQVGNEDLSWNPTSFEVEEE